MVLSYRVKIIYIRSQEPRKGGELLSHTLPENYATASEAIDAGQKFITDNGFSPDEAFCEITDLRGYPDP